MDNTSFNTSCNLNSDTVTIINPLDEDPLSKKNIWEHAQYQYGGVNVSGRKLSVGLEFRVVDTEESYNLENDRMIVDHMYENNDVVEGIVGYDYVRYHDALKWLYRNRYCW